jgi:hypothetical protein
VFFRTPTSSSVYTSISITFYAEFFCFYRLFIFIDISASIPYFSTPQLYPFPKLITTTKKGRTGTIFRYIPLYVHCFLRELLCKQYLPKHRQLSNALPCTPARHISTPHYPSTAFHCYYTTHMILYKCGLQY